MSISLIHPYILFIILQDLDFNIEIAINTNWKNQLIIQSINQSLIHKLYSTYVSLNYLILSYIMKVIKLLSY